MAMARLVKEKSATLRGFFLYTSEIISTALRLFSLQAEKIPTQSTFSQHRKRQPQTQTKMLFKKVAAPLELLPQLR